MKNPITASVPAWIAVMGYVWFLVTASVIQGIHFQGAAATPISTYLRGGGGAWMQGAYYVLAVALVVLAFHFASRRSTGHAVAAITLVVAAIAVTLVAYSYSPWPLPAEPVHAVRIRVHVESAFTAFLAVTLVMFLETPLLWQGGKRVIVLVYASAVFALEFAAAIASTYAQAIYGALEKLSVAGLVLWLLMAAFMGARVSRRN